MLYLIFFNGRTFSLHFQVVELRNKLAAEAVNQLAATPRSLIDDVRAQSTSANVTTMLGQFQICI